MSDPHLRPPSTHSDTHTEHNHHPPPTSITIPPLDPAHNVLSHSPVSLHRTSLDPGSDTAPEDTEQGHAQQYPSSSARRTITPLRQFTEPLRNRLAASQTFAEGMTGSIQSLRRLAFERKASGSKEKNSPAGGSVHAAESSSATTSAVARPVMPRSRPSMAQFKMQPPKMIIPPPYGQEAAQEAAKALAAGIPDGIPQSNAAVPSNARVMSDTESSASDEEPEVRVHFEIHLQEDADSEPICPLSEKNLGTLVEELDLSEKERAEVQDIQTKEDLAAYFEKLPRDYDVQIIITDTTPESPGVTFAQDDMVLNGESIAIVRRESISSYVKEKKSRRRKQRYRRPTTDLSNMPIEEPKASWLELFYDLLFVANLTEFTHSHPIRHGESLGHYIGWFVIMWWAWAGQTFWAARFDMDDLFSKLLKLVEFCALISFGAFSSDHLNRTSTGFIGSYMVLKAVLIIEYGNVLYWARRNRSKQSLKPLLLQIGSNCIAIIIWGVSTMVHNMVWRYVMWYVSIMIEVAVLVSFGRRASVTFAGSHLPERFALFTIIVLGENIIGLIGLSAGASAWERGQDTFLVLFLLVTVILYSLWWLYFDDFSEDIFHKTTTLSQLWAYLHLPLHVCIVLVGTGALDLIRLFKEEHHIKEMDITGAHLVSTASVPGPPPMLVPTLDWVLGNPAGFETPLWKSAAGTSGGSLDRQTDYNLTKQYFLVVCSLVFLCNSLLKWINLRSYDRFQKIVYVSRLLNAFFILCLLAVPPEEMTPFALLGSMAFFCVVQVFVDLAVIYFGAYGFVEDMEAWARSARSSIDLGSFLPTPLRSRANSRAGSRAGSVVNLNGFPNGSASKHHQLHTNNNSMVNLTMPGTVVDEKSNVAATKGTGVGSHPSSVHATSYFPQQGPYSSQQQRHQEQQYQQHQQQLSLQQQSPTVSQQQQQALYNMHVNANSLGSAGAYGNLVQALAEIKNREKISRTRADGSLVNIRQVSLSAAENCRVVGSAPTMDLTSAMRGRSGSVAGHLSGGRNGNDSTSVNVHRNSISLTRPGSPAAANAANFGGGVGTGAGGRRAAAAGGSGSGGSGSRGSSTVVSPMHSPPIGTSSFHNSSSSSSGSGSFSGSQQQQQQANLRVPGSGAIGLANMFNQPAPAQLKR